VCPAACCLLPAACCLLPAAPASSNAGRSPLAAVVENYGAKKKKGKEWQDAMLSSNLNFDLSSQAFSL
jgi:hypothetical protein